MKSKQGIGNFSHRATKFKTNDTEIEVVKMVRNRIRNQIIIAANNCIYPIKNCTRISYPKVEWRACRAIQIKTPQLRLKKKKKPKNIFQFFVYCPINLLHAPDPRKTKNFVVSNNILLQCKFTLKKKKNTKTNYFY